MPRSSPSVAAEALDRGPSPVGLAVDDSDGEGRDEGADVVGDAFTGSLADLHDEKSA